MNKSVVSALICLLFTVLNPPLFGTSVPSESAVEVIEKLNATLLECMKRGDELGHAGRYALLETIMKKYFFFPFMVRKSTGSYWESMDADQQKQLLKKYIIWSVGTYADRFTAYKGQTFTVVSSESVRNKYMRVMVHITNADQKKRQLEYLLIENKEVWRIIDIKVKGVSQLSLTRAQFKSVLKSQGIKGLLKILDEKIDKVNQEDSH